MSKKQNIINAATHLFATLGYDATTTLKIAKNAGVTEPLIYYHFKGKNELFTLVVDSYFSELFLRLGSINNNTKTEFEKIKAFIDLYCQFIDEKPIESYLLVSTCPQQLKDPDHVCAKNVKHFFELSISFLSECIEKGVASDEFRDVPVKQTAYTLAAMINGLIRHHTMIYDTDGENIKDLFIDLCSRSLLNNLINNT